MKKSFKRYLSLVMVLMVAFVCLFGVSVKAADATLSFENKAQRTTFTTSQQVWEQNGVKLVNDKAASTSNVADYAKPARFYASSKITVSYTTTFNKIVFDCNSSSYATALKNSIGTQAGVTVTVSSDIVTCVFTTPVESFVIAKMTAQVRMDSLTVTPYEAGDTPVASIIIDGNTYTTLGGEVKLNAVINNSDETATWKSADSTIATVDATGSVKGVKVGKTKITATLEESNVSQTIDFIVYPDNSSELSIAEAKEIAQFGGAAYTEIKYTMVGVITKIDNTQYGNLYITDGSQEILVYGLYSSDGKTRYDAMSTKPVVGDKIKVTGVLGLYNTTPQMKNGWLLEIVQDDETLVDVKEALNAVQSYVSLAYRYSSTQTIVDVQGTAEITFDSIEKRESYSTTQQVWTENGITFTNNKGASTSAVGDYSKPARFYKDSTVIISTEAKFETIEVYCNSAEYATSLSKSAWSVEGEVLVEGKVVTFNPDYATDSVSVTLNVAKVFVDSAKVYYAQSDGQQLVTKYDSEFRFRFGVDASIYDLDCEEFGIKVTANGKSVTYTEESEFWGFDDEKCYVTVSLGDVLTNKERLDAEFTVTAYVVVDGVTYVSESSKTYSVVSIVEEYMSQNVTEVEPLYNLLVELGKISK